jgi:hypothetical protein
MLAERLPPLEIFCPYCQPNLQFYLQFPQTAERKMKQAVFSVVDGTTSVTYSCEGCLELYVQHRKGSCRIEQMPNNGNCTGLSREYQEYLRRVFGEFELTNGKH